jgi:ribosomal protein L7Ae-like RNA K-turn-binding protein
VSVHARYRCVEAAVRTGALRRALPVPSETTAAALAQTASDQYLRRAEGLLQAARRARHIALGTEAVRDALAQRRVHLLVVAGDAEGSRQDLERAAEKLGRACLVWNTKDGLGRLFGRPLLSVLAILDEGIADELGQALRCVAELSPFPPSSLRLTAAPYPPSSPVLPAAAPHPPSSPVLSAAEES